MSFRLPHRCLAVLLLATLMMPGVARAQTSDLINMLTSQLGVSESQASGGAGTLFKYAQDQLSPSDFSTVSDGLPGVDSLIGQAPEPKSSSSMLGSTSNLLGGSSSSVGGSSSELGDVAGVASAFSDLGMSPDMVNEFVPVILDYAQSAGSEQVMQILQGALTGL